MCRRFFKCFEKCIECRSGEHVPLVDDEHLVTSYLWRYTCLFHERLDLLYAIVGGSVQLKHVVGTLFLESLATFTFIAGISVGRRVLTVDSLGKNAGTSGLSDATRTAEQIGMSQLPALNGVFQSGGQCRLSYHGIKCHGTVLACRDNIFFHNILKKFVQR